MNAPIVNQKVGTRKMPSTATAPAVDSTIPQRIDSFIAKQFNALNSAGFSGIKSTASRAATLGFKSSANSRYVEFLEAFQGTPALAAHYAERYPASRFLPWKALHIVLEKLQLWCELPEFYVGAVPEEQLPWMEIFELDACDAVRDGEVGRMLNASDDRNVMLFPGLIRMYESQWGAPTSRADKSIAAIKDHHLLQRLIMDRWKEAQDSFFVVAPKEAFSTTQDWMSRFRQLLQAGAREVTVPPDDPLVIRFCRGGCLVVAAWGDEGAWLNAAVRELEGGRAS